MSRYLDLARGNPGPVYVYDLDRVADAVADLRAALPDPSTLFYSLKANPHEDLVRFLRESGCRAEVSSTGELLAALRAGYRGTDCLYTGPGKTDEEIREALRHGVVEFSVESEGELNRLDEYGVQIRALLRVNATRSAASGGLHMTGAASQFGIDAELIADVLARAEKCRSVTVTGLHLFSMTNAQSEDSLIDELTASLASAVALRDQCGQPIRFLDLGGGFATPYTRSGHRPVYRRLRDALERELDAHFAGWRGAQPMVAFESGRYLVGDCGELLCTVTDVKVSRGKVFVVLDAGVNVLGGLSGVGRLLPLSVRPLTETGSPDTMRANLVGPLCTPVDVLGRDLELGEVEVGDRLVIPNVGAYGMTASLLAFLSRPAPREIVVRGERTVSESVLEIGRTWLRR